ncbi:hypothetical protein LZ554_005080 [Drepanopeziza brunnea f. sp. 'monogermtubi']|nr:hypothetical protein LZ554_005080 [Drepanopeziza brunnea f. sp. 'monogermtubi']
MVKARRLEGYKKAPAITARHDITAPPKFPNGLNLYHIGFAALKYPELAPRLPVPLSNIIASQYLDTLMAQQTSRDVATLNDSASDQYYFSRPLFLLNFLTANPSGTSANASPRTRPS